jgi:hypothetical protein
MYASDSPWRSPPQPFLRVLLQSPAATHQFKISKELRCRINSASCLIQEISWKKNTILRIRVKQWLAQPRPEPKPGPAPQTVPRPQPAGHKHSQAQDHRTTEPEKSRPRPDIPPPGACNRVISHDQNTNPPQQTSQHPQPAQIAAPVPDPSNTHIHNHHNYNNNKNNSCSCLFTDVDYTPNPTPRPLGPGLDNTPVRSGLDNAMIYLRSGLETETTKIK